MSACCRPMSQSRRHRTWMPDLATGGPARAARGIQILGPEREARGRATDCSTCPCIASLLPRVRLLHVHQRAPAALPQGADIADQLLQQEIELLFHERR